jgi:hypothetical protein
MARLSVLSPAIADTNSLFQKSSRSEEYCRSDTCMPKRNGRSRGQVWREEQNWPNGRVHYFGKFLTEKEAVEWIADHESLTKPIAKKHD